MEHAQHVVSFSSIAVVVICAAIGVMISCLFSNAQTIATNAKELRNWRWTTSPAIFAPPPQLREPQRIIMRDGTHEVAVVPGGDRGGSGIVFQVHRDNHLWLEFVSSEYGMNIARYYPPGRSTCVGTLGIVLYWFHPDEYAIVERFCEERGDEITKWFDALA